MLISSFQESSVDLVVKVSSIVIFLISLTWSKVMMLIEKTKYVELTGACAAYIADAANVAVATRTTAVANGTNVATGSVGRANMSHHNVC